MSRLTTGTHSFLTEDVIRLLHSKNIRTTEHFINTDTKQLASITNLMHKVLNISLYAEEYTMFKYSRIYQ